MKKAVVIPFLFITMLLSAQDAVQWRGDRTGVYKETELLKSWPADGPQLLWHYDDLGEGHTSVAIDNNKIFVTGMTDGKGFIYAFDMNGKLLNKKEYGAEWTTNYPGTRATMTPNSGKLYFLSGTGNLYCCDANSLDIIWQKSYQKDFGAVDLNFGYNESPLVIGDKLIITPGGKEHNIVALNKKDGSIIWSARGDGEAAAYCSPIYISELKKPQMVTIMAQHAIGIDVETGQKLWSYKYNSKNYEHPIAPLYGDNMLLLTSAMARGSEMVRFVDGGKDVEKVWQAPQLDTKTGHLVKVDNYVYGTGDKMSWYCFDWKTGQQMYKDNSLAVGAVIVADGMLYCYTLKGEMALVRATSDKLEVVSKFPITMGTEIHLAHPVIYQGVLYVRHGNTLMAYKIKL